MRDGKSKDKPEEVSVVVVDEDVKIGILEVYSSELVLFTEKGRSQSLEEAWMPTGLRTHFTQTQGCCQFVYW